MTSRTTVWLITAAVIGLLTFNLILCGLFSYWGVGIQQVGPRHIRTGSVGGVVVGGGGPGTGK